MPFTAIPAWIWKNVDGEFWPARGSYPAYFESEV